MKSRYLLFSIICVLSFVSCSFFTTSLAKGASRDMDNRFSKFDTKELADMCKNPELINDSMSSKALLKELGQKEDLSSLSEQQKNDVLNLMSNLSIPVDVVVSISETVSNVKSQSAANDFVKSVFDQISSTDTNAASMILSDQENLSLLDDNIVCMSSICLIAQVAKSNDLLNKTEQFQQQIKNIAKATESNKTAVINNAVTDIFGGIENAENAKENLEIAFNAIYSIRESSATVIPGMSLKELFEKLGDVD